MNIKKISILLATLLLSLSANAKIFVTSNGNDTVTITDESPCSDKKILDLIKKNKVEIDMSKLKSAKGKIKGVQYNACWFPDNDSVHMIYEDGDQGLIPASDFEMILVAEYGHIIDISLIIKPDTLGESSLVRKGAVAGTMINEVVYGKYETIVTVQTNAGIIRFYSVPNPGNIRVGDYIKIENDVISRIEDK